VRRAPPRGSIVEPRGGRGRRGARGSRPSVRRTRRSVRRSRPSGRAPRRNLPVARRSGRSPRRSGRGSRRSGRGSRRSVQRSRQSRGRERRSERRRRSLGATREALGSKVEALEARIDAVGAGIAAEGAAIEVCRHDDRRDRRGERLEGRRERRDRRGLRLFRRAEGGLSAHRAPRSSSRAPRSWDVAPRRWEASPRQPDRPTRARGRAPPGPPAARKSWRCLMRRGVRAARSRRRPPRCVGQKPAPLRRAGLVRGGRRRSPRAPQQRTPSGTPRASPLAIVAHPPSNPPEGNVPHHSTLSVLPADVPAAPLARDEPDLRVLRGVRQGGRSGARGRASEGACARCEGSAVSRGSSWGCRTRSGAHAARLHGLAAGREGRAGPSWEEQPGKGSFRGFFPYEGPRPFERVDERAGDARPRFVGAVDDPPAPSQGLRDGPTRP
jgi:hypothetical protein